MSDTVKVEGLKELSRAMQKLGRKTATRIAKNAMYQGGVIIRDDARQKAPILKSPAPNRKAGTLKKAIKSRTKVHRNGTTETIIWVKGLKSKQIAKFKAKTGKSGAKNPNDPFYWKFVEFGTSKMRAKPFLRPAFQQSKNKAANTIIKTLQDEIIKECNK
ncbi:phage protein, HK97 gp10 family [Phocoenobacter uteri]|uniref:Phage protein, HK97 gp10 family n=1 Tax=Phocoenobacter uteri TaxID=146806 RepID=A0A379CB64_9PAST|nr:HK97-gp10 family putative phage morphogenesis protein [Phocoenobacter uteri]SUB58965.1 phage protein, HK97 gp10 family [Phocoenobacter uteri]